MLYHVSLDFVNKFELRVPSSSYDSEDQETKRICFSKSIEGAITAMPYNINIVSGLLNLKKEYDMEPILYVYSIDEKDLKPGQLKDSSELVYECRVADANMTGEVWVLTEDINPKLDIIKISDCNFDIERMGNFAMYIITKLQYEKATQEDVEKNKLIWDEIDKALQQRLNKTITPVLKRAYIASLSSFNKKGKKDKK